MSRRRSCLLVAAALATLGVAPAATRADGPPVGPSRALVDVLSSSDGRAVFVVTKEPATTLVQERDAISRRLLWQARVPGQLGLPQVTAGGAGGSNLGGLSPDGRTLVLQEVVPSYPSSTTRLALLRIGARRPVQEVRLRAAFAVDALSPQGETLYLVQDRRGSLFSTYSVRAYDVRLGRLVPGAIVDRTDRTTIMQGVPLARATSRDGSWVYTIYAGGPHTFVHALHTSAREAFCVDLPWGRAVPSGLTAWLANGGRLLRIADARGRALAVVDTRRLRLVSAVGHVHAS